MSVAFKHDFKKLHLKPAKTFLAQQERQGQRVPG